MIGPHHAALDLAAIRVVLTTIFILILTLAAPASEARAMRGVALIIGNSAYQHLTPLTNPEADADAIEKLFDELGFETYDATDADLKKLRRTIDRFIEDAEGVDVALVYYAGHGVEAGGENYLVPVDADVSSLDDATEKLVPLSGIMSRLREVAPLSFVLLDACRDNPFPPGATIRTVPGAEPLAVAASGLGETRTMGKFGKAAVEGKTAAANDSIGTLIGFAAEPGQRALDGEPGGNSPYAAAVLRHVPAMAGEEISTVMRMVAEEVYLKTSGRQRPWVNENLRRLVYLGATPPEVEGAQGDILRERRQLLINIASLPSPERKAIEAVAREGGVSMDAVYAMLKRLGQDAPKDPVQLERLLQDQLAKLKELEAKVDAVESKDPEIARLSGLASQAMAEGAIDTALKIHEQAKERARDVSSNSLDDTEAALKERRMELAEVFASSARDNFAAFNYAQAAKDYEEAFNQVERWDDFSAWSYRGNQAVALMELGWKGGATDSLRKSAELARDIVVLSERLEDRANWALSQTFLGNTLATLGQRLNDQQMIADSIKAYEAALTVYGQDAYPKERRDVLQNLAGSTKQVAQRFEPARARVELAKSVKMFDELLANADRSQDGLGWASLGMSKGMTMIDLARINADVPMLRDTVALLTDVAKEFEAGTSSQQSNALCNLANAWSELGIAAKQVKSLETADDYYGRCIPLTDKAVTPVLYSDQLTARSLNYHNLYLQTDDAAWLDRAVPLLREARDSLDPAALPIEWRSANTALAGALLSVGRARNDAKSLAEALELYAASQKFFDPAKESDQWADNLSRLADTRRNIGEIVPAKATFDLMLDEHEQALHSISAEKFPAVAAEIRQRISWISTATSRLQDKLPEDEAIALLQRGAAILERPQSDGPLASVQSELGRRTYIKAVAKDDVAGLRQAILLYRRSLVEGAKDPDYDTWRVTRSNLALALRYEGERSGNQAMLHEAAKLERYQASAKTREDNAAWLLDTAMALTPQSAQVLTSGEQIEAAYDVVIHGPIPALPTGTGWEKILHFAQALMESGYSDQDPQKIRRSVEVLDAMLKWPTDRLSPAGAENVRTNLGSAQLYLGDVANDPEALTAAIGIFGEMQASNASATGQDNSAWLNERLAISYLLRGEIADQPEDWRHGLDHMRGVYSASAGSSIDATIATNAGNLSYGISNAIRVGVIQPDAIGEALNLADEAVAAAGDDPDLAPYAIWAQCLAHMEQGRIKNTRSEVEGALALCRSSMDGLGELARKSQIERLGKTIAYAEELLKKM